MVPQSLSPTPRLSLLHHRPFALFWIARVATTMAFHIQGVGVGWQIYELTGSAFFLGLVGLTQFLPICFLTLVVGQVVDRYDRRLIGLLCQIVEGLTAGALAYASFSGLQSKESILAIFLVAGTARTFELPTMQALVPGLVPAQDIPRAIAGAASANRTATIVGPALGGLLYVGGPTAAYGTASVLFLAASLFFALIRLDRPPLKREPVTLQSLLAGFGYIRSHPLVLGAVTLDLFATLLGGATALLPIYARDLLGTGPWGLGLLRSAPAVGALATSLTLARYPLRHRVGKTMFGAIVAFGVATMVFAVSRSFALSLGALSVLGSADVVNVVIRSSLVQIETPDEMRGRVSAVNSLFIGTSNYLGEFESGLTATLFGVVPAVLIGGGGTIVVAVIWVRLFPALAQVDSLER